MGSIHSTSFYSQLTNWPNKLECYITVGYKCLTGTNTLAYWIHLKVTQKWSVVNMHPGLIHKHCTRLERLARDQHSSLLRTFAKSFITCGPSEIIKCLSLIQKINIFCLSPSQRCKNNDDHRHKYKKIADNLVKTERFYELFIKAHKILLNYLTKFALLLSFLCLKWKLTKFSKYLTNFPKSF